jgi:hypothetical protein
MPPKRAKRSGEFVFRVDGTVKEGHKTIRNCLATFCPVPGGCGAVIFHFLPLFSPPPLMNPSRIKHVFFWLSGAGAEALESCPGWEQRKYVAFGATVLVPAVFAAIASAYAISTLTDNWLVIAPVALVWAFIILTIDRALLASYRGYMNIFRKLGQFSLRFVVAMLMGLTIAHPLVLLLFRDTISGVIEKDRTADIAVVTEGFSEQKLTVQTQIDALKEQTNLQQEKWNQTFDADWLAKQKAELEKEPNAGLTPEQQAELKTSVEEATGSLKARLTEVEKQVGELTPAYTKVQGELAHWQAEFEREINGQRSGLLGVGPRAKSIQSDHLGWRRDELKRLGGLIETLTNEKKQMEQQIGTGEAEARAAFQTKLVNAEAKAREENVRLAELKKRIQEDQAATFVEQQNTFRAGIKQQLDTLLAEVQRHQGDLAALSAAERGRVAAIQAEPRKDILTQTLALHALFDKKDARGNFAFWTYGILTLLFMLVDTIPLLVKFFCRPGPYDTLVDRDEMQYDADHRAFQGYHKHYLRQLRTGKLAVNVRSRSLETALTDGVEQTRAAQAFMDSIMEMEAAFHQKMVAERAKEENSAPEKAQLLETMKDQFYASLKTRMEQYFASAAAAR